MQIRAVRKSDRAEWLRMRCTLFPGDDAAIADEIDRFCEGSLPELQKVLVAETARGLAGFVELSIRPHAEGCLTQRVGYVEAWFVDAGARRHGIGAALIAAAEDWARRQGCTEFASDSAVDNEVSALAHRAIGFEEVGLVRCFRKTL